MAGRFLSFDPILHPFFRKTQFIFFTVSTGLALLVAPLVSDVLLGFIVVRMLVILLVIIGILNNLYMMYGDLTALYFPDIHAFEGWSK